MASDINTVMLVGRLTKDPTVRSLSNGMNVCDLRLAYTTSKKAGDGWEDKSNFIDVSVWGAQGDAVARNLSKGRRVGIVGSLEFEEWQSPDGTRSKHKVTAQRVQYLDAKDQGAGSSAAASSSPANEEAILF